MLDRMIQKAPQLLTPIKLFIDKKRENGEFLLTGSANVLNLKKSNESLAGRLIELTMYPFSAKADKGSSIIFINHFINCIR